jgi:O-antigen/teichoic acid export membrane protein
MGVAVGGFLIVAVVAGDWILARLVYDGRFTGQGTTLAWLAAAVLATAASVIFGNGLWAIERPKLNLSADIVALVATVSLALWWIPSGGAVGAASAICIGNSAGALVRGLVFLAAIRAIVDDGQIDASGPPESSAC